VIIASTLHRSFKTLLGYAGLPAVRFHALRHTAATLMLEANVNPRVVQEMLGHANIRQTMDTYSHVLPNMHKQQLSAWTRCWAKALAASSASR
jgi:integrase